MKMTVNIERYFQRVEFKQDAFPDLNTLTTLISHHSSAIPFENLDPLLKVPVNIDLESVQIKLVEKYRGGYCFEQNTLLYYVLKEIGFDVVPLAGRVLWHMPENTDKAQTHMLLMVTIEEQYYLVDVGFGGVSPTAPILFKMDEEQPTQHGIYRIKSQGDIFFLQVRMAEWQTLYSFSLQPQRFVDFEVMNWYTSTYPKHLFTNVLAVSKTDKASRITLHNRQLSTYKYGERNTQELDSVDEIKSVLRDIFKIELPDNPQLDVILSKLK